MIDLFARLRERVEAAVREAIAPPPEIVPVEFPPDPRLGDLATPVALGLARVLRRPPREIAQIIAEEIEKIPEVESAEVAGPGFVNIRVDRDSILRGLLQPPTGVPMASVEEKVIVEHTNINPNKAAHIGHLRNAVLGDTLVRLLRALGHAVEVQNYVDDTGVQVADVVVALVEMSKLDERGVSELIEAGAKRADSGGHGVDHDLWDLYAKVTPWYEESGRSEYKARVLHALESGEGQYARVGRMVSRAVARCHLATMSRIGVRYDLLPKESDILGHKFWETAFKRLQQAGAIALSDEGKTSGCWIMNLPHDEDAEADGSGHEYEKIIVRSDGTVTYVGKDIAYQLWKFGLLDADFDYAPLDDFAYEDKKVWETTAPGTGRGQPPAFGRGRKVFNVIDARQSYLQRVVQQGLDRLGHIRQAEASIHFSYEMVTLTPKTAEMLLPGLRLSAEERSRPFLDMSGRKGLGVKADDLIDQLEAKALEEVASRNPDLDPHDRKILSHQIAIGALRYYMLRFARMTRIAFDVDAALAFEGETGPYCQYASVRVHRIVDKLQSQLECGRDEILERIGNAKFSALPEETALDHWRLLHTAARFPYIARQAIDTLELGMIAHYAFELAQAINGFYHRHPVLKEPVASVRDARLAVLIAADRVLRESLSLMGVPVPERM